MPQPHSTLEKDVQQILSQGTQILGAPAPRLLTGQPQVPANGLRHGLTGQNTFLSDPEMVLYLSSGVDFFLEMQPVGIRENHLLQRIIDADWRLNRVPFLQENLLKIGEFREAKRIRHDNPGASEQTVEVYARGGSFHDVSSDFEKIGRHEIRLDRLLNSMHHEYERRQESRRKHHSSLRFNLETCKGYLWYRDALAAAELMLESRRKEAQAKSPVEIEDPPITPTESVISEENLVCKSAPETMTQAHAAGLPIDLEKPAQDPAIPAETLEDTHEGVSTHISADTSADISEDLAA
jgi:hypothetical protein